MVYVDNMKARYRNMVMCHMVADTSAELFEMSERLGLKPKWVQKPGTAYEHFDICRSKRVLAVSNGAVEITGRQLVEIIDKKK